jgi:hypothetical protein
LRRALIERERAWQAAASGDSSIRRLIIHLSVGGETKWLARNARRKFSGNGVFDDGRRGQTPGSVSFAYVWRNKSGIAVINDVS